LSLAGTANKVDVRTTGATDVVDEAIAKDDNPRSTPTTRSTRG